MEVRGKKYEVLDPSEVTVRQGKNLLMVINAYADYVDAKPEEEEAKYQKLKPLWKTLTAGVIKNTDSVVQDIDNLTAAQYSEFISSFFPQPSEAKQ